jgi:hypothetical protein
MNKVRFTDLLIEYGASFDRLPRFNLLENLYREVVRKTKFFKSIKKRFIFIGNKCITLFKINDGKNFSY